MGITTGENASSLAGLLLTTEAVVTEKPEPKSGAPSMPGGGGMGDMYMY
jgi:chaperonin GroEL